MTIRIDGRDITDGIFLTGTQWVGIILAAMTIGFLIGVICQYYGLKRSGKLIEDTTGK